MTFRVGEWTVNPEANLLTRGEESVRLEHRVMAVLARVAEARGGVVSKDDLIDHVWKGASVSDHSVANAMSDLRKALGDDRSNPQYIETIPKRGYRLVADCEFEHPPAVEASSSASYGKVGFLTRWTPFGWGVCGLVVLCLVGVWIALSLSTPGRLYLGDIQNATGKDAGTLQAAALSELFAVALAGGDRELVRWRETASGDARSEPRARARDRVLRGRVIEDQDGPILALELSGGRSGATLWAESYALSEASFASLAQIAATDLASHFGEAPSIPAEGLMSQRGVDPAVYEAYWRARYLWSLREHGALREARRILADIIQREPQFAPAHAALADIYAHKTAEEIGIDRAETYLLAEDHLARAEALHPNMSEASVTRAYLSFFRDHDPERAARQIEHAIRLRPQNATAWQTKAMIASAAGDGSASHKAITRAAALDPRSASILWDRVWFLYVSGRYDAAASAAVEARRVSAPVLIYEALIDLARGDFDGALERLLVRAAARGLNAEEIEAIRSVRRQDGARAALSALADRLSPAGGYSEHPIPAAILLQALERDEEAVNGLIADRAREKSWWWSWFEVLPAFDRLRDDPRLMDLVNRPKPPA